MVPMMCSFSLASRVVAARYRMLHDKEGKYVRRVASRHTRFRFASRVYSLPVPVHEYRPRVNRSFVATRDPLACKTSNVVNSARQSECTYNCDRGAYYVVVCMQYVLGTSYVKCLRQIKYSIFKLQTILMYISIKHLCKYTAHVMRNEKSIMYILYTHIICTVCRY